MPTRQKARTIDELSDQLTRANLVIVDGLPRPQGR